MSISEVASGVTGFVAMASRLLHSVAESSKPNGRPALVVAAGATAAFQHLTCQPASIWRACGLGDSWCVAANRMGVLPLPSPPNGALAPDIAVRACQREDLTDP